LGSQDCASSSGTSENYHPPPNPIYRAASSFTNPIFQTFLPFFSSCTKSQVKAYHFSQFAVSDIATKVWKNIVPTSQNISAFTMNPTGHSSRPSPRDGEENMSMFFDFGSPTQEPRPFQTSNTTQSQEAAPRGGIRVSLACIPVSQATPHPKILN
jgi:hypothetical protein